MDLETNPNRTINFSRPKIQFWSGHHFILLSATYLLSTALFSVLPEVFSPWWTWGVLFLTSCILLIRKSTLGFACGVGMFLAFLCVQYGYAGYRSIEADVVHRQSLAQTEISGTVTDIGAVTDAWSRSVIELEDKTRYIVYLPSTPSTLLWNDVQLVNPEFQTASLFEFSRWLHWSVRFDEIKIISEWVPYRYDIKLRLIRLIQTLFPYPESALLNGILIWDDSLMDSEFNSIYRWIGLSHITVVSGSNISAILAILILCLKRIQKLLMIFLTIWALWIYVVFVWAEPPVVRAFITGSVTMIALTYGNKIHSLRVLLFTGCVLTAVSPFSLLYDPGFELSFLATLGILTSVRLLQKYHIVWQAIWVSVFAWIWTLPVTIGVFWNIHLWSIPANILVWPAVAWSMLLGFFSLLAYSILPSAGLLLGHITYYLLAWINIVAQTLVSFPWYIQLNPWTAFMIGFTASWIIIGFSLRYLRLPNIPAESVSPSARE